jgi:hypothetical protein
LSTGFRSVSDDDFARVTLAQAFALVPQLDPTGTSWLPVPFWLNGGAMMILGRSLFAARSVAVLLAVASTLLVYVAASWLLESTKTAKNAAFLGALAATLLPWSARLGVATVPELPTAALTLVAVASLASQAPRRRLWGALALFAATLSRYEPWPVAAVFAAFSLWDGLRSKRLSLAALGLAGLLGPALWVLWNGFAHGSPLAFVERVAAYKQALGEGGQGGFAAFLEYPTTAALHEPELALLLVAAAIFAGRGAAPLGLGLFARPAFALLAMTLLLAAASLRDAGPTHHPERALLVVLLFGAVLFGHLAALAWDSARDGARLRALGFCLALFAGLVVRVRFAGALTFVERTHELALGEAAAREMGPSDDVLVEVTGYGFFALQAASGRPERMLLDRGWDPRRPLESSSFADRRRLAAKLAATGARAFVTEQREVAEALGATALARSGELGLYATPPSLGSP